MGLPSKLIPSAIREVQRRVRSLPPLKNAQFLSRYIGSVDHEDRAPDEQSQLKFLGFSAAQTAALAQERYSFSDLAIEDQLEIWLALYHSSPIHDELNIALNWMTLPRHEPIVLENPEKVFALQRRIDNWAISDTVSDLIANLIERNPARHMPRMKKWNVSKNPWERRQSLVGLYCYARSRKNHLPARLSLPLVENRIGDPHYFVQKAVGWTLREIHHVDPAAQKKFLSKHLGRLSSIAFTTAVEKYSASEKSMMKDRRAKARKQSARQR